MDEAEDIEIDYYAVLGVNKSASADEIRGAFRKLSKCLHPDKQNASMQEYANTNFQGIERAYQVLGNTDFRKAYDLFGEKGVKLLERNKELILRSDSMDTLEDVIRSISRRELEVKSGQSSTCTMLVNASSLLQSNDLIRKRVQSTEPPKKSSSPLDGILLGARSTIPKAKYVESPKSKNETWEILKQRLPKMHTLGISQTVETRLSPSDTLILSGQANVSDAKGIGALALAYRRQISGGTAATVRASVGSNAYGGVEVSQRLTDSTTGSVSAGYSKNGMNMSCSVFHQMSPNLIGSISASFNDERSLEFRCMHVTSSAKTKVSVVVGDTMGISLDRSFFVGENKEMKPKLSINISSSDISVGAKVVQKVGQFSQFGMGVRIGVYGVYIDCKFSRGSTHFKVPVLLSPRYSDTRAIAVAVCAPAFALGLVYWRKNYSSSGKAIMEEAEKQKQQQRQRKYERDRLTAQTQIEMMKRTAVRRVDEEKTKENGLVILKGLYGTKRAIGQEGVNGDVECVADVTIPLQFLVNESSVKLYAGSKKDYLGFYHPSTHESDEIFLYVRYMYHERVYEITVEDIEPLYLPTSRSVCMGIASRIS